ARARLSRDAAADDAARRQLRHRRGVDGRDRRHARFPTARHLVAYLGLNPRVRQSGSERARHGRISKQGPGEARHLLVEAAWHAARTTGPLRAFAERIKAKRGANVATVVVARKLVVIA